MNSRSFFRIATSVVLAGALTMTACGSDDTSSESASGADTATTVAKSIASKPAPTTEAPVATTEAPAPTAEPTTTMAPSSSEDGEYDAKYAEMRTATNKKVATEAILSVFADSSANAQACVRTYLEGALVDTERMTDMLENDFQFEPNNLEACGLSDAEKEALAGFGDMDEEAVFSAIFKSPWAIEMIYRTMQEESGGQFEVDYNCLQENASNVDDTIDVVSFLTPCISF